jgi:hypothetical protein
LGQTDLVAVVVEAAAVGAAVLPAPELPDSGAERAASIRLVQQR